VQTCLPLVMTTVLTVTWDITLQNLEGKTIAATAG
jgi:hypothetical protein